jgi:K+-transporting ATPase ATPase C chain
MNKPIEQAAFFPQIVTSGRIMLGTMAICCLLYPALILGIGQTVTPHTANGSLIRNDEGKIIGSRIIAQSFSRPEYLWPRPSAVDYNAAATGGSNLSPANLAVGDRARQIISRLGDNAGEMVPTDLVTASGSGVDPNITLKAARYQAQRVASARSLPVKSVLSLIDRHAIRTGGFLTPEPVVNVLQVNLALDRLERSR